MMTYRCWRCYTCVAMIIIIRKNAGSSGRAEDYEQPDGASDYTARKCRGKNKIIFAAKNVGGRITKMQGTQVARRAMTDDEDDHDADDKCHRSIPCISNDDDDNYHRSVPAFPRVEQDHHDVLMTSSIFASPASSSVMIIITLFCAAGGAGDA